MKDLAFRGLTQQGISEFDTTPDPGSPCFAWSTTTNSPIKWNGSFWAKASDGREDIFVDWILLGSTAVELFNESTLVVNFSTEITSLIGNPTTGQLMFIVCDNDLTKTGFYVIGSTVSLSAVPVTRHPEWPATRYLRKGSRIFSYRSPIFRVSGGNFDLDTSGVDTTNDTLIASYSKFTYLDHVVYKLILDSGATAPSGITAGNYYWATSDPLNPTTKIKFYTDNTFSTFVNITSVGVNAGSGKIGVLKQIAAYAAAGYSKYEYLGDDIRFQDMSGSVNLEINHTQNGTSGIAIGYGFAYNGSVALAGVAYPGSFSIGGFADENSVSILSSVFSQNSIGIGASSQVGADYTLNKNTVRAIGIGESCNINGAYSIGIGSGSLVKSSNNFQVIVARTTIPSASLGFNINGNYHFENRTTNSTETRLYVYLNDTTEELVLNKGGYTISGKVFAVYSSDTTKFTIWKAEGFIEANGPSTPPVINIKFIPLNSSGGTNELSLKIRAAVVGNSFTLYATGIAATNIWWWADLKIDGIDTTQALDVAMSFASGKHTTEYLWLPASEAITAGAPINIWNDSGTVKVRNANASNGRAANGYVTMTYGTGDMVAVFLGGENPVLSGLTIGDIYLGTSSGSYTSSVPGTGNLVQKLGFAISSSNLAFMKEPAIQT